MKKLLLTLRIKIAILIRWILNTKLFQWILSLLKWFHCWYADYLAEQNGHWYHVFLIGWSFRILNVKEVDSRKLTDIKYAKRVLKLKHAKIHATMDFSRYCIYTARPKR